MVCLKVLNGKREGAVFEVAPGHEQSIGHRETADVAIDDPWVSWDHARLFFQPEDPQVCWIEDLGSTNGTYVNCVRIKRERLQHEDIIFLGKTHVVFLATRAQADSWTPRASDPTGAPRPASAPPPAGRGQQNQAYAGPSPFASSLPDIDSHSGAAAQELFSEVTVDPFSSGPDYSLFSSSESAPDQRLQDSEPGGASSADLQGLSFLQPQLEAPSPQSDAGLLISSPFAETRGDSPPPAPKPRSLRLSDLQPAPGVGLPAPSSREIAELIEGSGVEAAARPKRASESLTRPLQAARMREILATEEQSALDESAERTSAGAFRRAHLENQVRRLQIALQAMREQQPAAAERVAAQLRDEELQRLTQRVAELEASLYATATTLEERERELNLITEEMIQKEDQIEMMRRRQQPRPPTRVLQPSEEDLSSLEF